MASAKIAAMRTFHLALRSAGVIWICSESEAEDEAAAGSDVGFGMLVRFIGEVNLTGWALAKSTPPSESGKKPCYVITNLQYSVILNSSYDIVL